MNWSSSAEVVKGESKGNESKERWAIGAIQAKFFKRVKWLSKEDYFKYGKLVTWSGWSEVVQLD